MAQLVRMLSREVSRLCLPRPLVFAVLISFCVLIVASIVREVRAAIAAAVILEILFVVAIRIMVRRG